MPGSQVYVGVCIIQLLAAIHQGRGHHYYSANGGSALNVMDQLLHNGSINWTTPFLYPTGIFTAARLLHVCEWKRIKMILSLIEKATPYVIENIIMDQK